MNNTLNWKVPSRSRSVASASSNSNQSPASTPSTSTPGEITQRLCGVEFSSDCNDLYFSHRYGQSPASSCSYSLPPRPASGSISGGTSRQSKSPKQYWELGGLGPSSVATPEWQVHKERWLAKKAFGKAATAANRLARLRALGKIQQEEAQSVVIDPAALELPIDNVAEEDESAAVLAERAKKRDIALALKL